MGTVQNVASVQTSKNSSLLARLAKAGVVALAGTGLVGTGVYTGVTQYEQTQQVKKLTDEISGNQLSIQNMRTQVNDLNNEVSQNQLSMQNMRTQINGLNTRITLDQVMDIVKKITPSTVRVEGPLGLGSGVILITHNNRYILTNGHVTQRNDFRRNETRDSVYHIKLYNGTDFSHPIEFDSAPVILGNGQRAYSSPEEHDLALLQIPPNVQIPTGAGVTLRNLQTDPVRVGEAVIAIGNPFGERDSVTFGIISHIDRQANGLNINHHFQTDAPINPGNSGGGLFDMQGRLVGINTWGYRGSDGIAGSIRVDEIINMLNSWGVHK